MQVLERYEVVKDEVKPEDYQSIVNWEITDANGKTIGKIEDVVVDLTSGKIRYILGKTNPALMVSQRQPYFILPVGLVSLLPEEKIVEVKRIDPEWLTKCPPYHGGEIEPWFEKELAKIFGIEHDVETLYEHAHFQPPKGLR